MSTDQLHVRELHIREVSTDTRTFTGIAVPYDQQVPISDWFGDYNETFARGSVQDSDDALLFWRHSDPIGRITSARDTDGGWEVTAAISQTPLGDEAYTLLRDGVVTSMSVGFQGITSVRDDETGDITRTAVRVREVSLVPIPAYDGAVVTDVRHRQTNPNQPQTREDHTVPEDLITRADLTPIEQQIEDLRRGLPDMLAQRDAAPVTDTRSAGQIVLALARGDEDTVRAYEALQERAWGPDGQGGVLADDGSLRPQWVGDLTRLIDENSGLPALFSTGTLPDRGMKLEFGELNTNTTQVGTQAKEGDNLVYGKVTTTSRSTDVITVGGYTGLSRQEIERSNANMVDLSLRGMAIAARKNKVLALRKAVATLRAKQISRDTANGRTTVTIGDQSKYTSWIGGIIDAAGLFDDQGLSLENLLVDKATFKGLATMTDTTNRPLMTVYGEGTNAVGVVSAATLGGNIAGLLVRVDPRQTDSTPEFINSQAIRVYNSPVASLTDSNIVNLTQLFSVYYYAAMADEIPGGLVPVVKQDPAAAPAGA